MHFDAVVLGAAGYGGGELLRLLAQHPAAASLLPVSRSQAGRPVKALHPHLHGLDKLCFSAEPDWVKLEGAKPLVLFSALRHGELAERFAALRLALDLLAARRTVHCIDLSADFRLADAQDYAGYYGAAHPCPEFLGDFVYGLPELEREALRTARWVANPGCFATALCLTLLPLSGLQGLGLVALSGSTGSSGSGVHPGAGTHHPARAHDFRAYTPLTHRHLAEAENVMRRGGAQGYCLSFVPHSAPLVRGIHVTLQALLPPDLGPEAVKQLYHERFATETFVRLVESPARVATVIGSNYSELYLKVVGRQLAVTCTLDNLGKGMASQAIQNMNIMLGLVEGCGLAAAGVYP